MIKQSITFLLVLFSLSIFSQSSHTNVSSKKNISVNFNTQAVKAYQESAVFKIKDYYQYLGLYSNATTSDSLKVQLKTTIQNLFDKPNETVIDFTTKEKNKTTLQELLKNIEHKNYTFKINDIENSIVALDFWTTKYNLEVTHNNASVSQETFAKVYFKPVLKEFGSKTKEVWVIHLGSIE
jgi:hypothetical protein